MGVLHFMHASSLSNYGRVVVEARLSSYLAAIARTAESWSRDRFAS